MPGERPGFLFGLSNIYMKQQIQFPLLYNFQKDTPHVDNTFRNVEELNSPVLNDMIQPMYCKEESHEMVFDNQGVGYYIENGSVIDTEGNTILPGNSGYLHKEDLEQLTDCIGYCKNGEGKDAYLYDTEKDGRHFRLSSELSSGLWNRDIDLGTDAVLIEARLKYVSACVVVVMYYDKGGEEYLLIDSLGNTEEPHYNSKVEWMKQSVGGEFTTVSSPGNMAPAIHIADRGWNNIAVPEHRPVTVSLTQKPGMVNNLLKDSYFFTVTAYIRGRDPDSYVFGKDIEVIPPDNPDTITYSEEDRISISAKLNNSPAKSSLKVLTKDWNTFYNYYDTDDLMKLSTVDWLKGDTAEWRKLYLTGKKQIYHEVTEGSTTNKVWETFYVANLPILTYNYSLSLSGSSTDNTYSANLSATIVNPNSLDSSSDTQVPQSTSNITRISRVGSTGSNWIMDSGSQKGQVSMSFSYKAIGTTTVPKIQITAINVVRNGIATTISNPDHYINSSNYYNIRTTKSTPGSIIAYPCVCLDDGTWYSLFELPVNTTQDDSNSTYWPEFNYNTLVFSCKMNLNYLRLQMVSPRLFNTGNTPYLRSGSYICNQEFFELCLKLNNKYATSPSRYTSVGENESAQFTEVVMNSLNPTPRYTPGTVALTQYNYYSEAKYDDATLAGGQEDYLICVPGGHRVYNNDYDFGILYNTTIAGTSYISGISVVTGPDDLGTLVTPWFSIDESNYIFIDSSGVVYRDKDRKWHKIYIDSNPELRMLFGRYLLLNTIVPKNCYDTVSKKVLHYANDYNGRVRYGTNSRTTHFATIKDSSGTKKSVGYMRYTGDGINVLYTVMPRDKITSILLPRVARTRVVVGEETATGCYSELTGDSIDIFYSTLNSITCQYKYSLLGSSLYKKHNLIDLIYPGTSTTTSTLTPNLFTKYVDGAGNNDIVLDGYDAYTLYYYDSEPYFLWAETTRSTNVYGEQDVFFVIQGQFYGVIGNKLYSLSYDSGQISARDAIIDLGAIRFIGNNPMIAFWWDPASRSIKSFTGDANLEHLYSASKFEDMASNNRFWYDKTTQSIYVNTDRGLLVFGPKNTYMMTKFQDVTDMSFDENGIIHLTAGGGTYSLSYYPRDGYEVIPVRLETSFYGIGANQDTNIDRWDITLFNPYNQSNSYLKATVRSLTDISVKSTDKEFKNITNWDGYTNSVLIRFVPSLQKGQGLRLELETNDIIQKIVPHITDLGAGTLTRRGM